MNEIHGSSALHNNLFAQLFSYIYCVENKTYAMDAIDKNSMVLSASLCIIIETKNACYE